MSEKFEIEYFTDMISGPRYVVDMENGEIRRDDSFISGDAAISEGTVYPGNSEVLTDHRAAEKAYGNLIASGIEPGEKYMESAPDVDKGVRVRVYDDTPEDLDTTEDIDRKFIDQAVESIEEVF